MTDLAIELTDVHFAWPRGEPVLAIAKFEVARGERVFLKGASGSGKSTLLGLIGGVLQQARGSIQILGTSMRDLRGSHKDAFRAAHIGFIFQMFNLLPFLSVLDNVTLPARFSRARAARAGVDLKAEARRLLAALGLSDPQLLLRPVTALSIGQQQRVAAARALLGRPDLLIADEPTSALDAETRLGFIEMVERECAGAATTLLFVSHDTALSRGFDRTVSMDEINRAASTRSWP
ncbi:MAG TPA: ATP-binding cassette domain-containing protein [Steroidobacteraceae bacterium]|nr:ATP-binding cassette domain-containing protein [Steroidobacteraceae bacterium]HUA26616.1 ATP-binding cassette domain-containing protein [Steroidobacteraceae bacterium]